MKQSHRRTSRYKKSTHLQPQLISFKFLLEFWRPIKFPKFFFGPPWKNFAHPWARDTSDIVHIYLLNEILTKLFYIPQLCASERRHEVSRGRRSSCPAGEELVEQHAHTDVALVQYTGMWGWWRKKNGLRRARETGLEINQSIKIYLYRRYTRYT